MTRPRQKLAIALVLMALGSSSFAQFGGGMGGGRRGRSPDAASAAQNKASPPSAQTLASRARDQLYDLRVRLLITPEQAPLWDGFYDKAWDLSVKNSLTPAPAAEDLTAAQAIQQRAVEAQERAARLQGLSDAVTRLYTALTPEQQHVADQYLPATLP